MKLEVTPADLKMFAEAIVQRTMAARQEELNAEMRRVAEETWLNTRQVRELLNVCEGTLNLWAKRGYLVPVKVGNSQGGQQEHVCQVGCPACADGREIRECDILLQEEKWLT